MNAVVALRGQDLYTASQVALIRRTVAKDCNDSEFDLFVTVARNAGLDPFRKQIMALVFNKDVPDKRRMSLVTGIDGLRAIADRSGTYSPDDDEPEFSYEPDAKDPKCNPLGIIRAKVKIFKKDKPVIGVAYWDEFAPIEEENSEGFRWVDTGETWADTGKPKKRKVPNEGGVMVRTLNTSGQWGKMPRVMLAKCAEAQALRKAYPEDLSGLYEYSELDRASTEELTPSEIIGAHQMDGRLQRIGASSGILFQLFPNTPLEVIPLGQIADRIIETVKDTESRDHLQWFMSANRAPLQEFWARAPTDALEVKRVVEAKVAKLSAAA